MSRRIPDIPPLVNAVIILALVIGAGIEALFDRYDEAVYLMTIAIFLNMSDR